MAITQYKVVEHEYLNRSVPEEDWGSTHDVVSDVSKYVIWREELDSDMPNEQVLAYLSELLSDQMEEDNAFDCVEYNYFVYRSDGGKWKWVGKLTRTPQPDDLYEYETDTCPHCGGSPEVHKERACEKCGDCLCGGWCDFIPELERNIAMRYFMLTCEVYLLGPAMILAGIGGSVLAMLYLKCDAGVLVASLAVAVIAFGIFDIVVTYQAKHHLDHWMD